MAEGDPRHSGPPARRRLLAGVVGLLVVLALLVGAGWQLGLADRWGIAEQLGLDDPDPRRNPAAVEPPAELELPEPDGAGPVAAPLGGGAPDPAAVRRALRGLLDDKRLGRRVAVAVSGLDGVPVVALGPGRVTPASTVKLLTALVALETLGPEHRFTTSVVADPDQGRAVTLVGGGDPLLARTPVDDDAYPDQADLATLAREAARQLRADGLRTIRLTYDDTLFSGPAASPAWEPDYLPDDVVSPITALWVDQGRERLDDSERSADPSADAAAFFAAELRRQGIRVTRGPVPGPAPAGATEIAAVEGAELAEVVQHVLEVSDNEAAEVLARHAAITEGLPASFAGAGAAVLAVLDRLGVPTPGAVVLDGSGLARGNLVDVRTLLAVLAMGAGGDPDLSMVTGGLPVAGFSGSLGYRFTTGADEGLGWVRAKTGTLVAGGVHGMAGVVTGRDGTVMLFVAVADRVKLENTLFARDRLDQVAAALADCTCSR